MANINCPECGKEIPSEVKECPKCGYPNPLGYSEDEINDSANFEMDLEKDLPPEEDKGHEKSEGFQANSDVNKTDGLNEKPVYRKWWFWTIIVAVLLALSIILIISCASSNSSTGQKRSSSTSKITTTKTVKSFGASYHGFFTNLVLAGEAPKKEDFKASLFYTNSSSEEVSDFTIEPNEFNPIGNGESAVYTIRYEDYETTVTVKGVTVVDLNATYESGTSYLFVSAELSDGRKVSVDSGYSVSEPVINGNEETVTVSFGGKKATATKTVKSYSSSTKSYGYSSVDATAKYKVGDRLKDITGNVIKVGSNAFWLKGNDGIEYKCFPASTGVLSYITVGNTMTVDGDVLSTSKMSCNLKNVIFDSYGF